MITTAGMTHSQAVGVSPKTRWTRDGRRSSAAAGKDGLAFRTAAPKKKKKEDAAA